MRNHAAYQSILDCLSCSYCIIEFILKVPRPILDLSCYLDLVIATEGPLSWLPYYCSLPDYWEIADGQALGKWQKECRLVLSAHSLKCKDS